MRIHPHMSLKPHCSSTRDTGLHGRFAVEKHGLELRFECVKTGIRELHHDLELLLGLSLFLFAVVQRILDGACNLTHGIWWYRTEN